MICLLDVKSFLYNLQKTQLYKLIDIDKIIILSYKYNQHPCLCHYFFTYIKDDPLQ